MIMKRALASVAFFALCSSAMLGQSADAPAAGAPDKDKPAAFEAVEIHPSPHSMYDFPRTTFHGDRYTMRQANLIDLIAAAYTVEADNVVGGPAWLEADRFDIYAKTPPKTTKDATKPMLRALLADRFKLVLKTGTKPMPAFVLSAGKGAPKMTQSDGSAEPGCDYKDPPPNPPAGTVQFITFVCHNISMDAFASSVHDWAGGYLANPVVNSTGLEGGWDFEFHWTAKGQLEKAGADGLSVFDAVEKELGLKLEAKTAPLPVITIESAQEKPTPNAPDIDKILPPPPPPEFEVATIRPSRPDAKTNARIQGSQVTAQAMNLTFFIAFAYDLSEGMSEERIVNAPKFVDSDKYDLLAKAAVDTTFGASEIDVQDLQVMMRKFLADRFHLQAHMEDRPLDAYTLLAASPKLKKADPANRTDCKEGPGADGKDPRIASPILGRLLTCRNMTMDQFAFELQKQANGYIKVPVLNSTGIEGNYDMTISFSSAGQLQSGSGGGNSGSGSNANSAPGASDPNGGLSLQDAISKQLGLKLVKQKRPVPVLVIDHIDEKPTEN
jgi:uncharacterized protein (TIGR03435 family)